MAVYVDEVFDYGEMVQGRARRVGTLWSHLMADSEGELREFAERIGLRASWIQHAGTNRVHFDVTPSRRARAIKAGALPLTTREIIRLRKLERVMQMGIDELRNEVWALDAANDDLVAALQRMGEQARRLAEALRVTPCTCVKGTILIDAESKALIGGTSAVADMLRCRRCDALADFDKEQGR